MLKKKAANEKHLYEKEGGLFGLRETITLYDLTNAFFEGASNANALGANGHSKEKRYEPKTKAEMLQDLEDGGGKPITSIGPTGNALY